MNLKTLLTTTVLLAASNGAWAFPAMTVTPAPGAYSDRYDLTSFNLSPVSVEVAENAYAMLINQETGDEVISWRFTNFMGMAILINFEQEEIISNGEWEFIIPANMLTSSGEGNPELSYIYTLNDPSLGGSEYPQISLVSTDPADGARLISIGSESGYTVKVQTTDDDAVNYIGWTISDVTDPENPEYVVSGNENRIDLNRNGHNDDVWTDGLYFSIGGVPQRLIKDHKYEVTILCAGIGYNPDTNQYPSPQDIERSKEMEASVYWYGLTDATEYSPYEYVSVSPDPETYDIDDPNLAMFTITYSGPVKPQSFNYAQVQGVVVPAGTYEPVGEADENGCCDKWEFTFSPSVIGGITGSVYTTIQTVDKDGLYVKGNGGYALDDYTYGMSWECNLGAPSLTSVEPVENATLESLSEIVVGNEEDLVMSYSYVATEPARILNLQGEVIRTLGEPVSVAGNEAQMKWTFDPITDNGAYVLMIPKYYFNMGEDFSGSSNRATSFRYIIDNGEVPNDVTYDLEPTSVSPYNNEVVTEINNIVLTFPVVTLYPDFENVPTGKLYKNVNREMIEVATAVGVEDDFFTPHVYTFSLPEAVTEYGSYVFIIDEGTFCDETYVESDGTSGRMNAELLYTWYINEPQQGNVTYDIVPVSVTPKEDESVETLSEVVLDFGTPVFYPMFQGAPEGKLYRVESNGAETMVTSSYPVENDYWNPTAYTFAISPAVTEIGNYKFVVEQGGFCDVDYDNSEGMSGHASPELSYMITVGMNGINAIAGEDGLISVVNINGVTLLENAPAAEFNKLAAGVYIVNGVKVIKK